MPDNPLDKIDDAEVKDWLDHWPEVHEDPSTSVESDLDRTSENSVPTHFTPSPDAMEDELFTALPYQPDTVEETARKSGLAYSIGIVFFVSIAFMLLLGWGADLVLGSKPWGIVGGIVLGAIIGFIQVFRITSQIFASEDKKTAIRPLLSDRDDEE